MNIRVATRNDKEVILNLIKKLAAYEGKKPEEFYLTIDKIESHGFGENNYFNVLIAEQNNQAIGYAFYFFNYSSYAGAPILYLEDIFVEEEYRHQGIGKKILAKLANISIEKKCCRMEWHTYSWNEKAIQFYKTLGAAPTANLLQFRIHGNELNALAEK
ncbi:MAG: GNAT family N-acetyltransferase [Gammaproteobacteria bacterium RIFCSPHIGHO2_12_FULL_43_28]|nr:MAG: GNAT family N-acetyltransferase [Gammaproteobacteria bacterium RIFCSPHIGHO2_12_FULL_43_28]